VFYGVIAAQCMSHTEVYKRVERFKEGRTAAEERFAMPPAVKRRR
jgi:hypothetical protein